jgi:RimJ/RimL family protein N-acetyltransferase
MQVMKINLPKIETSRLQLRPLMADDARFLHAIWSDPEVTKFIPIILFKTKEELDEFVPLTLQRWEERGFGMFAVTAKHDDTLLGYCGLQFLNGSEEVEIYYGFSKDCWDNGFATEAAKAVLRFGFEEAKLDKISAVTQPENSASQNVLEKIGMKKAAENRMVYEHECAYFTAGKEDYAADDSPYRITYED